MSANKIPAILLLGTLSLTACTQPMRGDARMAPGWVAFGAVGRASDSAAEPVTTPEQVAKFVDTGERVVLEGKVEQVCRTMGCWLDIRGESGTVVRVMNRDHAFFIPRNAAGRPVRAIGYATVREQSVELLKHLAEDAGKSKAEIDAIVAPQRTLLFIADAVMLPSEGLEPPVQAAGEGGSK